MFAGVRPMFLSICLQWLFAGCLPAPSLTPPPPVPGFHRDSWDSGNQDPASRSGHRAGDLGFSHQPISRPWKLRSSWQLGIRWKVFQLQWLPTGSPGKTGKWNTFLLDMSKEVYNSRALQPASEGHRRRQPWETEGSCILVILLNC